MSVLRRTVLLRALLRSSLAAPILLAAAAAATPPCGPGAGDCYVAHPTGGCVQTECCELVCEFDLLCCDAAWDVTCVEAAEELCVGIACPNPGGCTVPHDSPGCEVESCCNLACDIDQFCCSVAWDALCVERASELCGVAGCTIAPPAGARDEGELCYERLNDGCNGAEPAFGSLACGEVIHGKWTSDLPRDVDWLRLAGDVASIEFAPEFPGHALLVRGECLDELEVLAEASVPPCGTLVLEVAPAWRGDPTLAVVLSGGTPRGALGAGFMCDVVDPKDPDPPSPVPPLFGLRYLVSATCATRLGDLDGDGIVGGSDLTILLAAWGSAGGPADLDEDGSVGGSDLTILLANWG